MNTLYLIRGIPGAGKTTLAEQLGPGRISADEFPGLYGDPPDLYGDGQNENFHKIIGVFHPERLVAAHEWCQQLTEQMMQNGISPISVHNTFTTEWEMNYYFELAKKHDYRVTTLIVENRHESESVHNVPKGVIQKMKDRFCIKL